MFDGVRRQLIDQKTKGYGAIRVDIQRLGLNLNFDVRRISKQARRHGLGDFAQICVHRDGPAVAGVRYQVVKLGNCCDARLHRFIALNEWWCRRSGFVSD